MNLRNLARISVLAALLACALMLSACGASQSSSQTSSSTTAETSSATSAATPATDTAATTTEDGSVHTPAYKLNGKEVAVIKTSKGTIKVKFFEKDAPVAVANFIELANKGFYDGIRFHRFVEGFVIQGGDPQTKSATAEQVAQADAAQSGPYGTGGPGYTIVDEYASNPNKHVDGTLAMARTGAPNSAGSQFYFALGALPNLDGQYTVFGQTTDGLDVIHKLRAGDLIEKVTIENASK